MTPLPREAPGAWAFLALLTGINLFNYVDRQIAYAVFPQIQAEFRLADVELGLLASAFMVVYLCAAPVAGPLGDRGRRVWITAGGVALWSLATVASGLAPSREALLGARALVGVGEAAYGTVAPSLIADLFPPARRGTALAVFSAAIPTGSALGYALGGLLASAYGWRSAFYLAGAPGLAAALCLCLMREPARGVLDSPSDAPRTRVEAVALLVRTPSYVLDTLAMAAMTFALGGLAVWFPTFLVRVHALPLDRANAWFGAITLVTGLGGSLVGGRVGDLLLRRTGQAYFLVAGVGFCLGLPLGLLAVWAPQPALLLATTFGAEFLVFLSTGPLNAILVNVSRPAIRATAVALNLVVIHLLGDAISPPILGWLSDRYGLRAALALGVSPLAVAGALCLAGARYLDRDTQRVTGPRPDPSSP